ncbi:hypothetical protein [Paraburkholderia azotifigens]|uniref:TnsA endonuclease N-terminal domain-containing protein n=1 Tax=Paraburkholderia azotifigens TaxID=2057004 RepID=A0A5C6VBW9_9BURK|nr:hypothetical protein [Paraburkholderia azotifigens]TXC82450.1 hypothetical protein FRZ40_18430 [Paraburkholderia azotifigens]
MSITYPKDGDIRIKTIISRSNARPTGKYPSWKMERMMHWSTRHELNAYRLLDVHPAVLSFSEHPLRIAVRWNGTIIEHWPQVLVDLGSWRELWYICTAEQADVPDALALTDLLQTQLPKYGYSYRVVTGEMLARQPRLSVALSLLRYGRRPIALAEREHMRCLLAKTGFILWGATDSGILGRRGRAAISRLALEGILQFDYDAPLGPHTAFMLKDNLSRR